MKLHCMVLVKIEGGGGAFSATIVILICYFQNDFFAIYYSLSVLL
jgi:hypothetical protein